MDYERATDAMPWWPGRLWRWRARPTGRMTSPCRCTLRRPMGVLCRPGRNCRLSQMSWTTIRSSLQFLGSPGGSERAAIRRARARRATQTDWEFDVDKNLATLDNPVGPLRPRAPKRLRQARRPTGLVVSLDGKTRSVRAPPDQPVPGPSSASP